MEISQLINFIKNEKRLFITGTNTGVGKTFISSIILNLTKGTYFKPVQTGILVDRDLTHVQNNTHLPNTHFKREVYTFNEPISPHYAAELNNTSIDIEKIINSINNIVNSPLIVEGAGGILTPLNYSTFMIDLAKKLDSKVILVTEDKLGTISDTLSAIEVLKIRKINLIAIILNRYNKKGYNYKSLLKFTNIPVFTCIQQDSSIKAIK